MKIKVEVNGLVYASSNPKCKCILSNSQRKLYAFLLVLDGDMTRRYWGEYDHDAPEDSIGNDSNLLIVFYVQIMPDDFIMQLHRF